MAETLAPTEPDAEPRLRYRASDVRAMLDAGVLDDEQRYEVIDGEIVPMMAHNPPHIHAKRWFLKELTLQLGRDYWVDSEASFYLEDDGDYAIPDILVYPLGLKGHLVRGPDALLVVEVADKSLKKDRGRKARLYARFGVREYLVVDALTLTTHLHADPAPSKYAQVRAAAPEETLIPALLPQVRLRLADVA